MLLIELLHLFRFGLPFPLLLQEPLRKGFAFLRLIAGARVLLLTVQRGLIRLLSARLQIAEVLCTRLGVCLVRSAGGKGLSSSAARTGSVGDVCRGLSSCQAPF